MKSGRRGFGLSLADAANQASQNNRSIPRGTRAEVFTSYQVQGGQESRLREGRGKCASTCLFSALVILANFKLTPEIRTVLAGM
jgi:hypothetical protein